MPITPAPVGAPVAPFVTDVDFEAHVVDSTDVHGVGDVERLVTPPLPTVLVVGDSITTANGAGHQSTDQDEAVTSRGYWNWARWLMGERYTTVAVRGASGETAAALDTRIQTELDTYASDWVVVETGANSVVADVSAASIEASITSILDKIEAEGRRCCLLTVWPSDNYSTVSQQKIAAQVSRWIKGLPATRRGLVVADAHSVLADPLDGTLGTGMTYDGVHPGSAAAYRVGRVVADAMEPFAAPVTPSLYTEVDTERAMTNPHFLTNGDGWTLNAGSGLTIARDPDRFGNKATATVGTAGMDYTYLETLGSLIDIGDRVQFRARIRWSGLTWSSTFETFSPFVLMQFRASSGSFYNADTRGQAGNEPSPSYTTMSANDVTTSGDVVLTTGIATIPASVSGSAINRVYFKTGFRSENLSGGTVTVSDVAAWIVP